MEKKEITFNNGFLAQLRKKAKPLSEENKARIEADSLKPAPKPTYLSTHDTTTAGRSTPAP